MRRIEKRLYGYIFSQNVKRFGRNDLCNSTQKDKHSLRINEKCIKSHFNINVPLPCKYELNYIWSNQHQVGAIRQRVPARPVSLLSASFRSSDFKSEFQNLCKQCQISVDAITRIFKGTLKIVDTTEHQCQKNCTLRMPSIYIYDIVIICTRHISYFFLNFNEFDTEKLSINYGSQLLIIHFLFINFNMSFRWEIRHPYIKFKSF